MACALSVFDLSVFGLSVVFRTGCGQVKNIRKPERHFQVARQWRRSEHPPPGYATSTPKSGEEQRLGCGALGPRAENQGEGAGRRGCGKEAGPPSPPLSCLLARSLTYSTTDSLAQFFTFSVSCSLTHSLNNPRLWGANRSARSLTHSLAPCLTHSLTHSLLPPSLPASTAHLITPERIVQAGTTGSGRTRAGPRAAKCAGGGCQGQQGASEAKFAGTHPASSCSGFRWWRGLGCKPRAERRNRGKGCRKRRPRPSPRHWPRPALRRTQTVVHCG